MIYVFSHFMQSTMYLVQINFYEKLDNILDE